MTDTREDRERIERESHRWPTVRPKGSKVKCPECGAEGWAGGQWTHNHLHHSLCACGKKLSAVGFSRHAGRCPVAKEASRSSDSTPT